MSSLYEVMQEMKAVFINAGFTTYDQDEFDEQGIKVIELPQAEYPVILISDGPEENQEESPLQIMSETGIINLNVVLNTGKKNFMSDCATLLRSIKNVIGENRSNQIWCNWKYTDSFRAVLRGVNKDAKVYGGMNINTSVEYREKEIKV